MNAMFGLIRDAKDILCMCRFCFSTKINIVLYMKEITFSHTFKHFSMNLHLRKKLTKEHSFNLVLKMKHQKHEITLLTKKISGVFENLMYLKFLNLLKGCTLIIHFILLN